ncbi:MAG: bifunctional tetrahydrofolate synthase/dihydrofolate synthase [Candidatus Dactylopiibacterium carminicum]|uniref:Dihydrofolate synthase/folylpolyglutamate synthase n=1 Tax=Candidatus Dactylopiibacterium carminicum TaxID=857335 RepID=A0A272EXS3_9RHOO|nr:bifunctional tetrahydrofolate synthase/dihydrofolate synthase [Candidatus Dactylopiibacterium carminicum]KAF7600526.1 bifunctional tetrahydrofolate synthase/dihydrofolate synthase [Candidatus Dactylopiibacterium carminicum]PAS94905.1 MAG: bifunctional tetrahydrofolate synthase/dihydrofolate synthase [Candidatus Dactylopiibacterium carminicum]PAT00532.1 MAG: bifunctional folylpolyglutamate synthase/dihydrofolate synthase [Candidatus Dactylopiibacterium carminicum]
MPAVFATLDAWLAYIESQHSRPIDLGLERVVKVRDALGAVTSARVITVGGTNGKGSTCAMLEAILRAAGYRVGVYSSPHLLRYNERVRVEGMEVGDEALCTAFAAVEAARGDTSLTYFEYGTLAAWWLFCQQGLDVIVLEVGLGGRLDAVNAIEPDCSIVTGVALDHMDYLGDTREKIGFEKSGIFRAEKPAVCGDPNPPQSLLEHARAIGAQLWVQGRDFGYSGDKTQWNYRGRAQNRHSLAYPALRGANQLLNAATVLAALESLQACLPVSMQAVREGLMHVEIPARFQILPGKPPVVLDVAHNPQAAGVLAENLLSMGFYRETWAVCGMLSDKDIAGTLRHLLPRIDHWLLCDLQGPRAATASMLKDVLRGAGCQAEIVCLDSPAGALQVARERAGEGDRIVAFGSFLTVAGVMQALAVK